MASPSSHAPLLAALLLVLAGCSQPTSNTDVEAALKGDALVLDGTHPEDQRWNAKFTIENAPAGEYLAFESATRPTSLAELASFKPETCTSGKCSVVGLGDYVGRNTLTTAGPMTLEASPASSLDNDYRKETFFVIVRRAAGGTPAGTAQPELKVKARVFIAAANGGCGTLDPPAVRTQSL